MPTVQSKKQIGRVADAPSSHWVYGLLPQSVWPFAQLARWERPIGWQLLLWPCWWALFLTAQDTNTSPGLLQLLWYMLLFAIGAMAMRGAGCTFNDLVDTDIDAKVERTRSRPLPSGKVSKRAAVLFLVAQALIGLLVVLQFNRFSVLLAISSLLIVAVYPFMKRITNWPQLVLGLAFAWGALVGGSVLSSTITVPAFLLYIGCVSWIIGYDTIYAHQDREDDALIGIGSTARRFGSNTKRWLAGFYLVTLICFGLAFAVVGAHWLSFAALAIVALHFAYQIYSLNIYDPDQCLSLFKSNNLVGLILFAGLAVPVMLTLA